jgi:hypothetical protein
VDDPEHDHVCIHSTLLPGDAFAIKTGFDPRKLTTSYQYFRIHPVRLQAWREDNELKDRELMRGGRWIIRE